jgi:hypothetical protein
MMQSGIDKPPVTTAQEKEAEQRQNSLIAESCGHIISAEAAKPFANYGDAFHKLNAYHVRRILVLPHVYSPSMSWRDFCGHMASTGSVRQRRC